MNAKMHLIISILTQQTPQKINCCGGFEILKNVFNAIYTKLSFTGQKWRLDAEFHIGNKNEQVQKA
jgi:hypothetical protein